MPVRDLSYELESLLDTFVTNIRARLQLLGVCVSVETQNIERLLGRDGDQVTSSRPEYLCRIQRE